MAKEIDLDAFADRIAKRILEAKKQYNGKSQLSESIDTTKVQIKMDDESIQRVADQLLGKYRNSLKEQ